MPELHVVRVFVGPDGRGGNELGVFLDGPSVPAERRQPIATELAFSETVYVDDPASGALRIFTPAVELPFAGHPLVGTAWLLAHLGRPLATLRPPAGEVGVRLEGELTYIVGRPEWSPAFRYVEHPAPGDIDALDPARHTAETVYNWAWIDREAGAVRARSFASPEGILEDEATGSAALALCARLERPITVHQGVGSLIRARPLADGTIEVGGVTELVEKREL